MTKRLPGLLLRAPASVFGDKVFYVDRGQRRWVRDGRWLHQNGFRWPEDVLDVIPDVLYAFVNAGHAPIQVNREFNSGASSSLTSVDLREIAACQLKGTGIEFGAGASPFPVPLQCNVLFADALPYSELQTEMYPGQTGRDLIRPDYVTDIQTLSGISDNTLDFIVACHVIEHTANPIAAIEACHRALKAGGTLVLVVPDMGKTFDSKRQLTSLEHLIEDYESPSRDRDLDHYEEFYFKAFSTPGGYSLSEFSRKKQEEDFSIHFHTWTYESFSELIAWIDTKNTWTEIWKNKTLNGAENIEFYFALTK